MKKNLILALFLTLTMGMMGQNDLTPVFRNWAPTPPKGWNSWDCYGPTVVESEVLQNARYINQKLKKHGWEYVVVDIRWFVSNDKAGGYNQDNPNYIMDEYGRYLPAENRFPSAASGVGFKAMADYIHGMGLKFGIHIMRGVPKVAVEKKLPIKGSRYRCDEIYNKDSLCTWLRDNYTVDCTKPGAQDYYNSIFSLYASWGVDFIKIDDLSRPYHDGEIQLIRRAIDGCGRPIVLSMSPGKTPIEKVESCQAHSNMWRMMDDYWDVWTDLFNEFELCAQWAPHQQAGNYPDCDMLPLGRISIRGERGGDRWTRFTRDEQLTMMNLWGIFHSPLFFGGELTANDAFTDSLLTNDEYMFMHSYALNSREVSRRDGHIVWAADAPQSSVRYAALFNVRDTDKEAGSPVTLNLAALGFAKGQKVQITDLWSKKVCGTFTGTRFAPVLKPHASGLYKLTPVE